MAAKKLCAVMRGRMYASSFQRLGLGFIATGVSKIQAMLWKASQPPT